MSRMRADSFLFNNQNTVSGNFILKPQGSLNKSPYSFSIHLIRTFHGYATKKKKKEKTKTETLSGRKFGEHRRCRRWLSNARKGADVENSCGLASTRVWRHQLQATTATERYALSEMHRLNLFAPLFTPSPPAIPILRFEPFIGGGGRVSRAKGFCNREKGSSARKEDSWLTYQLISCVD